MTKKSTKRSASRVNGSGRKKKARVRLSGPDGETMFEGTDAEFKRAAQRVGRRNIIPSNGDLPTSTEVAPEKVTIGEAMRRAVEELGDVQIDDELAPSQLRQLSEVYEDVVKAQAAFNTKSDDAKTAKKALESVTNLLLEKVRSFTHPVSLPLFDETQAADDHAAMLDGPVEGSEYGDNESPA